MSQRTEKILSLVKSNEGEKKYFYNILLGQVLFYNKLYDMRV